MRTGLIGADALGAVHVVNLETAVPKCRLPAAASERIPPVAPQAIRSAGADAGVVEESSDPGSEDAVVTATPAEKQLPRASLKACLCGRGGVAEFLDDRLTAIRRGSATPAHRQDATKVIQVAPAALASAGAEMVIDVPRQEVTRA
ncbi:hypothetical protein [Streptomyces sp. NPDC014006]|uniref:hypothetical protein n=1 Tax=Streptomyces sp. NPDC014006 TaxID=3364870 RepID=UPI0036FD7AAC